MKFNNKGFAVSSIMYLILLIAIVLIVLTLSLLHSRSLILDKQKSEAFYNTFSSPICIAATQQQLEDGNIATGNYNLGDAYMCDVDGTGYNKLFYVLEVDEDSVSLIMKENLTPDKVNYANVTNEKGPIEAIKYLKNNTRDWKNLKITLPTKEQTTNIIGNNNNYSWLYNYLEGESNSVTDIRGYWLKNIYTYEGEYNEEDWCSNNPTKCAYVVSNESGALSFVKIDSDVYYGVRPVITVHKNNLKESIKKICIGASSNTKEYGNVPTGNYNVGDAYLCDVDNTGYNKTFFVLENNSKYVALIMNRNITDENVNYADSTNEFGPIVAFNYLKNNTLGWNNVFVALPSYNQIQNIIDGKEYHDVYWIFNYLEDRKDSVTGVVGYWLLDIYKYNGEYNEEDWCSNNPTKCAYVVSKYGWTLSFVKIDSDVYYGVRPVIYLEKEQIG